MSFDNLKNYLHDIENVLDRLNDNVGELRSPAIVLKEDLSKEKELLDEIENLKNQIIESKTNKEKVLNDENLNPVVNHTPNNDIMLLETSYRDRIQLITFQNNLEIKSYKDKIQELLREIKDLKKEVLELKGGIRVLCRMRPTKEEKSCDLLINDSSIRIKKDRQDNTFEFDRVFDGFTNQKEVYKEVEGIVESIFDGYKTCLLAYGQTGSGKTYTIIGDQEKPGILGQSLQSVQGLYKRHVNEGWSVGLKISCIEIYNEDINDLLGDNKNKITIVHSGGCTALQNCTEIEANENNLEEVVNQGLIKRKLGSTMSNLQSSRSHTVFIMKIKLEKEGEERTGALCLIDLAGSERLDKSKSEGKRLKETQNINKSLSCLGDVFMAILNKESYVPFRNSKLTHFLQEYLTGNSRVSIILNVSQEEVHYHETLCTLRFGSKVSECKLGKVSRNILKRG